MTVFPNGVEPLLPFTIKHLIGLTINGLVHGFLLLRHTEDASAFWKHIIN